MSSHTVIELTIGQVGLTLYPYTIELIIGRIDDSFWAEANNNVHIIKIAQVCPENGPTGWVCPLYV